MKQSVDVLYQVFSSITGVTINQLNRDKDIILPSGKAISTAAAAHCLLEMKRTAVFLRGIDKAISLKLSGATTKPVSILYAGTGPYGTLFIPQEITVNAELISKEKRNSATYLFDDVYRIELGEVMKVDNENLNSNKFKKVFPIAKNKSNCKTLILTTTITVFGNHRLENSDCSLTLPLKMNTSACIPENREQALFLQLKPITI